MGIRETLNKNSAITTGATIAIIVIALIVIIYQMRSPNRGFYTGNKAFFTDDDGASWFTADRTNIPPFTDKNGLTAVRCYVYKCGKQQFVGYLEKYTDEAKAKLTEAGPEGLKPGPNMVAIGAGRLLKKKGGTDWVAFDPMNRLAGNKVTEIIQVKCPDGSSNVTPVDP